LVALAVGRAVVAADVGRERDVAVALEGGRDVAAGGQEADAPGSPRRAARLDRYREVGRDLDRVPRAEPSAGPEERVPYVVGVAADEQDLRGAAPRAPTTEAGREDAAPVQDEKVVRPEERGKIAEGPVLGSPRVPVEQEQARGVALGERFLGDGLRGEVVIEVRETHGLKQLALARRPLRRVAVEVLVGEARGDAAPRRAVEEADLEEIGLVDVLDRVGLLADRGRERAHADRPPPALVADGAAHGR